MITQAERDDALDCYYDYYKSVHGIKPRWMSFDGMTREEIQAEFKALDAEAEISAREEKIREQEAIERFEKHVTNTICMGARDRETALRWIMDSSEASADGRQGDWEYFCFLNGLPYGYFKKAA